MEGVQIGRVVHYVLTPEDQDVINRRRVTGVGHGEGWPPGAQAHVGNPVRNGEHVAMTITAIHGDGGMVNGHAVFDGNDSYWVTSRSFSEDSQPGTWHWPERA